MMEAYCMCIKLSTIIVLKDSRLNLAMFCLITIDTLGTKEIGKILPKYAKYINILFSNCRRAVGIEKGMMTDCLVELQKIGTSFSLLLFCTISRTPPTNTHNT